MKIKSNVRAGGVASNHNQTAARVIRIKSCVKAGDWPLSANHNMTVACGLQFKASVKSGIIGPNF